LQGDAVGVIPDSGVVWGPITAFEICIKYVACRCERVLAGAKERDHLRWCDGLGPFDRTGFSLIGE
jgi:hypothetical protein